MLCDESNISTASKVSHRRSATTKKDITFFPIAHINKKLLTLRSKREDVDDYKEQQQDLHGSLLSLALVCLSQRRSVINSWLKVSAL